MKRLRMLLITAGGLGHMRPASGTWGSTPPAALALLMVLLIGPHWTVDASMILLAVAFSIVCLKFGPEAEEEFGKKDPGQVVADEVAGQAIALLALPWRAHDVDGSWIANCAIAAIAFVSFRVMDILKPPPANKLQALRGGAGILVDDLIAGVYALIAAQVLCRFVLPGVL